MKYLKKILKYSFVFCILIIIISFIYFGYSKLSVKVEIKNTKDSSFNIIADKNGLSSEDYAGILIDSVQNCTINGIVSNNVVAEGFNTTTGCKLVEPKKLTLNISCNNDITNAIDLSSYNVNQVFTVNSKININGYEKQDITPAFNESILYQRE